MITSKIMLGSALVVLVSATHPTYAQEKSPHSGNYPNKAVRILCGASPGSGLDKISRLIAVMLADRWGRPVIVENRAGGAGTNALEILAQATPDGYNLSVTSLSAMTGWMTQKNELFNVRAFTPVVQLVSLPYLIVANSSLPVNSISELIAYAKSKPGVLNYGSSGIGSAAHLGMELFTSLAGVSMVHIPYAEVSLAMIDVITGRIQLQINNIIASSSLVKQGKLKALAVTSLKRAQILPELPTVSEAGLPGYELDNLQGIVGPAKMPSAIVLALNRESGRSMNSPETRNKVAADGAEAVAPQPPEAFRDNLIKQVDKWGKIILKPSAKI